MPGDITFDSGTSYFGGNLTAYVKNNTISLSRLDDMATRIVAAWYYTHQDQGYPQTTIDSWNIHDPINQQVNAQSDHVQVVKEVATGGIVLLKNEGALPLQKPKSIVLVGSDAAPPESGPNEYADQGGDPTGVLAMGWGSGYVYFLRSTPVCSLTRPKEQTGLRILSLWVEFSEDGCFFLLNAEPFFFSCQPYEAIQARARVDQTIFSWDFDNWDLNAAASAVVDQEVAIVFVNSDSGEVRNTVSPVRC